MAQTMLWYDLETFGTHPQWDRIAQFAAVRTDNRFQRIGEPVDILCRISPDYLPNPEACLVSRLTPRIVNADGLSEREFSRRIHELMSEPGTCAAGFNNLRFDDEFIRALSTATSMIPTGASTRTATAGGTSSTLPAWLGTPA
jgi:exodeoxyribonuclease-1